MKNNTEEIDKLIKETLSKEEAKFYDDLGEQNLLEMVGGLFTGKLKWILILMNIVHVLGFIAFVYCAIQFSSEQETNALIRWGGLSALFLVMTVMLKLFSWLQIDKNTLLRAIKRLEIQVSALSNSL